MSIGSDFHFLYTKRKKTYISSSSRYITHPSCEHHEISIYTACVFGSDLVQRRKKYKLVSRGWQSERVATKFRNITGELNARCTHGRSAGVCRLSHTWVMCVQSDNKPKEESPRDFDIRLLNNNMRCWRLWCFLRLIADDETTHTAPSLASRTCIFAAFFLKLYLVNHFNIRLYWPSPQKWQAGAREEKWRKKKRKIQWLPMSLLT